MAWKTLGSESSLNDHSPKTTQLLPYFVYILYSKKVDKYYVGETENIENRIKCGEV